MAETTMRNDGRAQCPSLGLAVVDCPITQAQPPAEGSPLRCARCQAQPLRQRQKASRHDPTQNYPGCGNTLQHQRKPQTQVSNNSGHHHSLLLCNKSLAKTTIGTQHLNTRQRPAAKPHQTAGVGRTRLPADTKVMASPTIRTLTLLSKSLLYPLFDR